MIRHFRISAPACLALAVALFSAASIGYWIGHRTESSSGIPILEEFKLKAAASHGTDTFAIATGPMDEDREGLFTLDFVTGELHCSVLNRQGAVGARFFWNVSDPKTFGAKRGKKPNYLLATGSFTSPPSTGVRFANTVCYVVDANTGEVAAFGVPWDNQQFNSGGIGPLPMVPLQKWATRGTEVGR